MTSNATQSSSSKTESDCTLDDAKGIKTKTYCKIYVPYGTEENIFFCNTAINKWSKHTIKNNINIV